MHELYELKDKLMRELEDYSQNGKFSKEDVEAIKYMSSAIDHLCNIMERADEESYSQRSEQGGRSMNSYNYAYARGRSRNARRDSMGRYSRGDGMENLIEEIRGSMQDLPAHVQQDAQRFIQKLEQM